jgi:hypothetical protein
LLHVLPQHAAQASRSKCPVLQLTLAGQPWHEGEASMRAVLGRLRGYRRWCEHSAVAEASVAIPAAGTVCWVQGSRFQIWARIWAQNGVLKFAPSGGPAG